MSLAAFAAAQSSVRAQTNATPAPPLSAPAQLGAADLEKLAAPIALYPDPLIAIMLPASAYPVEIVLAARFVSDTNNLAKLDDQPWDENVKAVARVPDAIKKMETDLSWTAELGQAFVEQPAELMDAIQSLRAKAKSRGTLQTTPQQVVVVTNAVVERYYEQQIVYVTNTIVQIQPANPQVIYVPTYNPYYVYYPPPPYYVGPPPIVTFAAGITLGLVIANNCDWYYGGVIVGGHGGVYIRVGGGRYPYYPPPPGYRPPHYHPPPGYRPPPPGYRPPGYPPPHSPPPGGHPPGGKPPGTPPGGKPPGGHPSTTQRWQPDQSRLRTSGSPGVAASVSTMEARGWSAGSARPSTRPSAAVRPSPSTGTIGTRPSTGVVGNRPTTGTAPSFNQPTTRPTPSYGGAGQSRPTPGFSPSQPGSPVARPSAPVGAFQDLNSGAGARDSSNRGAASRGRNNGGGGGRSGGRR